MADKEIKKSINWIGVSVADELMLQRGFTPVSVVTLRSWIIKYNLGIKQGGRFLVDKEKFLEFLETNSNEF